MSEHAARVGLRILGDERHFAVVEIHGEQAGRVAIAAVLEVERAIRLVEAGRAAGHRVLGSELDELLPLFLVTFAFRHEPNLAAGRRVIERDPHVEVVIGQIAGHARVLLHELLLARVDVDSSRCRAVACRDR